MTVVRRALVLVLLAAAGWVTYTAWARRQPGAPSEPPEWPPLPPRPDPAGDGTDAKFADAPATPAGSPEEHADAPGVASWVEPAEDGSCPAGHPVKLNATSGIFHVPGGRSYDRTGADRCYASAEAAEADGYRQAKA